MTKGALRSVLVLDLGVTAALLVALVAFAVGSLRSSRLSAAAGGSHDARGRGGGAAASVVGVDRSDMPIEGASLAEQERFTAGDDLFEAVFREPDGLGPLYVRSSCDACHRQDGRGPGLVTKMAVVEADGVTRARDQSVLAFGDTQRPYVAAGARRAIEAPVAAAVGASRPAGRRVRVTHRLPPAVWGRGYMEAVADHEIERLAGAAAARTNGIRGRIHRVNGRIGRFGLKARLATLADFAADALQGDMGLTSPARPRELVNPDGLVDDGKPGVDVSAESVAALADYVRLLEIPARRRAAVTAGAGAAARGPALFEGTLCAACHVPALKTSADFSVRALAGIDAPVYTDLLLHDMGTDLADGVADGDAGPREWRTAPLMGLRFSRAYLHDGRAATVEAAILAHAGPGSEAVLAVARFKALSPADRADLIRFVEDL